MLHPAKRLHDAVQPAERAIQFNLCSEAGIRILTACV